MELHGGQLGVRSSLDEGSTFFFNLPIAGTSAARSNSSPKAEKNLVELQETPPPEGILEDQRLERLEREAAILVVDDEPMNLQVLRNYFSPAGFEVTSAASGGEALSLLAEKPYGLVLLDVMMSKMSGYEVCRTIRETYPITHLELLKAHRLREQEVVSL